MSSSESKPKLSPVILEAMARNLSDHDLLRFMLSSKEAFNATLDVLSTVDYVNIHDENFENEPCIAYRLMRDPKPKLQLNYITKSNPIFKFVVNYLKGQITTLKTCDLLEIEPWVLNALMTSRLQKLSIGIVLPKSCKRILKRAPNLTKITFSTFDVFVANNFIPFRCKKISVDFLELYEMKKILKLPFTPSNVVENMRLGRNGIFLVDYDRYDDDYSRTCWKLLMNFLMKSFPSLETLKVYLNGYSQLPIDTLRWFTNLTRFFTSIPLSIEVEVYYDVKIPPSEWLAFYSACRELKAGDMTYYLNFEDKLKRAMKIRCFPDDMIKRYWCHNISKSQLNCFYELNFHTNWDEYDFDAENNQDYTLDIWDTLSTSSEEVSSSVNTISTQSLNEISELDLVITARDEFWSRESLTLSSNDTVNCNEFFITDSSQSSVIENSVKSDTETDTTSTSEDSTSESEDSDTSLDSDPDTNLDSSSETTTTDDDFDESDIETITAVTFECSTCVSHASTQDSFTD